MESDHLGTMEEISRFAIAMKEQLDNHAPEKHSERLWSLEQALVNNIPEISRRSVILERMHQKIVFANKDDEINDAKKEIVNNQYTYQITL